MDTMIESHEVGALVERIEELQAELARLRAQAAGRMPVGDAIRRAKAFDDFDEPARRRACRPKGATAPEPMLDLTVDVVAEPPDASGPAATVAPEPTNAGPDAPTRALDEVGRDVGVRDHQTALRAVSAGGRGAVLAGGKAALRLLPGEESGPAPDGRPGDLHVDADHALWFFGADGWVRLA